MSKERRKCINCKDLQRANVRVKESVERLEMEAHLSECNKWVAHRSSCSDCNLNTLSDSDSPVAN